MKTFLEVATRKAAERQAPAGTVKIVKVGGGYLAFTSMSDYSTWQAQK